jgi:hypothetical protein|tara:strand:+ start:110 stop:1063 length:954 start_codon:yes stop_codon:yes gene_type:complete
MVDNNNIHNITDSSVSIENKWFSKGFPSIPAWGWNKAEPKQSLYDIDMAHTANTFMLNLIEFVHWAPIIPAFLMAQSILNNSNKWTVYFDNDQQRTLLFLLSPIVAFFGGLPGIMMHTYEGWQVAPFDSPLRGELENTNVVVSDKNNQWLRIVAYFFIFNMQYIGLQAFSYAVLGPNYFSGYLKVLSVLGFFIGYLGTQEYKATFYFQWGNTTGGSTFPLAWTTLIPFMMSASLNLYAFSHLGTFVYPGPLSIFKSLAPPILIALGGAIEGLFAETIFDQKIHAFAVILFNAGFWLQLNMIHNAGNMLSHSCSNNEL